jgi:hypothetical protein
MPGLPKQAFPENLIKRPDLIGVSIIDIYEKGVYSGILKTGVFSLSDWGSALNPHEPKRCQPNCNKVP